MDQYQKDVVRHDAEISALKGDMSEVKADVKEILAAIHEAKGGWKTIIAVSALSSTVGAFLGKFLPFFK